MSTRATHSHAPTQATRARDNIQKENPEKPDSNQAGVRNRLSSHRALCSLTRRLSTTTPGPGVHARTAGGRQTAMLPGMRSERHIRGGMHALTSCGDKFKSLAACSCMSPRTFSATPTHLCK